MSPAPDRRRVSRSLGWFYLCAPAMAEVWLAFQDPAPAHVPALLAICVLAQALGVLLVRGVADDAPAAVLKGLLALSTVLVAGLCLVSGANGTGFAYLFLWATPYAFVFGLRHAVVQGVFAAALLIGVHDVVDADPLLGVDVDHWLIPVVTLVVVGVMVHRLTSELRPRRRRARCASSTSAPSSSPAAPPPRPSAPAARPRWAASGAWRSASPTARRCSTRPSRSSPRRSASPTARSSSSSRAATASGSPPATGAAIAPDADPEELPNRDRLLTGWVSPATSPSSSGSGRASGASTAPRLRGRGIRSTAGPRSAGAPAPSGSSPSTPPTSACSPPTTPSGLPSMADLLASALDRDESEARMRHQALHDPLTGLPNRTLLLDRLEHALRPRATRAATARRGAVPRPRPLQGRQRLARPRGRRRPARRARRAPAARASAARTPSPASAATSSSSCARTSPTRPTAIADRRAHRRRLGARRSRSTGGEIFVVGEHRHRDRAPARERRDAAPRRRRRDVPRQGARPRPLRALRRRACASTRRAPAHRERPAPRARARASSASHYQPIVDARRPAASLGVEALVRWDHPGSGLVAPGRVHRRRRGDRPDRAARRAGCSSRPAAQVAALAARATRTPPTCGVSVNLSAASSPSPSSSPSVAGVARAHRPRRPARSASRSPRAC